MQALNNVDGGNRVSSQDLKNGFLESCIKNLTVKQIYEFDESNFKDFVNNASDQSRFSEAMEEAPMDS